MPKKPQPFSDEEIANEKITVREASSIDLLPQLREAEQQIRAEWIEEKSRFLDTIAADRKRIKELEGKVAFWNRANERQYDKWIQLSRFWQKAENKPNTLPDRMKLLEWLIQHIQEGVESFITQTAEIERLRGALKSVMNVPTGQCKSPYGHGPEPNIDTEYPCEGCKQFKRIARQALEKEKS